MKNDRSLDAIDDGDHGAGRRPRPPGQVVVEAMAVRAHSTTQKVAFC